MNKSLNLSLSYSIFKRSKQSSCMPGNALQNILQFRSNSRLILLGFPWEEWLYLFQTVTRSGSAKMLQGCWHSQYYFQSYFTYAFEIYLTKNKNQLENGLSSVSGNADDLLPATKNGEIARLLAAKLKEGRSQHQYLRESPGKGNSTQNGASERAVVSTQRLRSAAGPGWGAASAGTPLSGGLLGQSGHQVCPWLLVTRRKPAGTQNGLTSAAEERLWPHTSFSDALYQNPERGKRGGDTAPKFFRKGTDSLKRKRIRMNQGTA